MTMRYFQNPNDNNNVYAYDSADGTQDGHIAAAIAGNWPEVTGNWPPAPTTDQLWAIFQLSAQKALKLSDTTMLHVQDAVALGQTTLTSPDVVAWARYRQALRAIINAPTGTPGTLPTQPPFPAGI